MARECPIGRCDGSGILRVILDPDTNGADTIDCDCRADVTTCPECGRDVDPYADDTEHAHWDHFHPDCYVDHINGPCPEHDRD